MLLMPPVRQPVLSASAPPSNWRTNTKLDVCEGSIRSPLFFWAAPRSRIAARRGTLKFSPRPSQSNSVHASNEEAILNKFTVMVLAAVLAGLFCAHPASAQNITKVSGDGQLISPFGYFLPMWVQVTDSNGAPQPGVTVNWAITAGGYGAQLLSGAATTTAGDGTTFNTYYFGGYAPYGSSTLQYRQNTVTASTANMSVPFTLSQALADQNNQTFVPLSVHAPLNSLFQYLIGGQTLTGQAGTSGPPIQVYVAT